DVDGGKTTLRTATYDLSTYASPVASYWRWYSNSAGSNPNADVFRVEISDDGGASWTTVETVGPTGGETSGGWFRHELSITDFVSASSQVVMRFVAEDAGGGSIVEAAVDDFEISDVVCSSGPGSPACFGDGSTIPCPCANTSWPGEGCQNSIGLGAILYATGSSSVGADDLVLHVSQARPLNTGVFLQGNGTNPQPFREGIL
ncbi:MAG: hypothetical protein KDC38_21670, partial [Planctomycetes bacterium]|nr:hypothetical protein [Planctomycetota bacterium]